MPQRDLSLSVTYNFFGNIFNIFVQKMKEFLRTYHANPTNRSGKSTVCQIVQAIYLGLRFLQGCQELTSPEGK